MEGPKMRIEGFYEEWKKIHFKEIAQRVSTTKLNPNLPRIEYEDIISGEGCLNKDITKKVSNKSGLYFSPFDLLYGKLRPYIKNIYLPSFEGVAVGDFWILRSLTNCPEFLYFLANSKAFDKVANVSVGSKMPRADWNFVSNSVFYIPSDVKEQQAIADFFQSLDSMITLTSKKIEKLKQTLTGCMQTMFPQEGELEPKIRFNEFEGEWKSIPLKAFAKKKMEKNVGIKYNITLTNSAEYGVINQRDFFDHDISNSNSIGGYYIINNDDFVYNPRISITAPVGPINRNQLGYTGIMSPLYLIFSVAGINKDFLSYFFKTTLWYNYMKLNGNSGARFDRLAISDDDFFNMPIAVPLDSKEQLRIANYFKSLNEMISLLSKRLDLLKHIKSACLDNMFV